MVSSDRSGGVLDATGKKLYQAMLIAIAEAGPSSSMAAVMDVQAAVEWQSSGATTRWLFRKMAEIYLAMR